MESLEKNTTKMNTKTLNIVDDLGWSEEMELRTTSDFLELPFELQEKGERNSIYCCRNYGKYLQEKGQERVFFYDENFLMPIIVVNKSLFRYAELPLEPIAVSDKETSLQEQTKFLDACMAYLEKKYNVMWVNHPETSARFQATPTKCLKIPYGNQIIDLRKEESEIWSDFDRANRNRINHGDKVGLEVVFGGKELLEDYYMLDVQTRTRSNIEFLGIEYYENILKHAPEKVLVAVVYKEGVPQGAGYFFYTPEICQYMYSATRDNCESGSINYMVWAVIRYMKAHGVNLFSFVGSRIAVDKDSKHYGIQKFKERFGGYLEGCFLFKVILKPNMYQLYHGTKKVRDKLKHLDVIGDIIDQEIHKWQDLNDPEILQSFYKKSLKN